MSDDIPGGHFHEEIEMSTKYTREQISKARQRADAAFDMSKEDAKYHPGEPHPEKAWIDTFTEALGLPVAPEKPEPGRYKVDSTGEYAIVAFDRGRKCLSALGDDGHVRFKYPEDAWPALTPARVVSEVEWQALQYEVERRRSQVGEAERALMELRHTEPVELSEAEVPEYVAPTDREAHAITVSGATLHDRNVALHRAGWDAALAKHGGARELPSRARVELALIDGLKGTGEDLSYKARQRATDAVMGVLGGDGA